MDFRFLYDPRRKLFSIGFNVDQHRIDPSLYDLLASEARLGSFIAIADGQVPLEHWFMLGRNLSPVDGSAALISWSGSMFEYLMPLMVMPEYPGTLLYETYQAAVTAQIEYGRAHQVPWGVSESGYNLVDRNLNYQYKAFGVPSLGEKRGLADDLVIAPYAAAMAVMVRPQAAVRNLARMAHEGLVGALGLYEAVDYTPHRVPSGLKRVVIRSFMAHHSGMTLLSIPFALLGRPNQRRFLDQPEFAALLLLLHERVPGAEPEPPAETLAPEHRERLGHDETRQAFRVFNSPNPPTPAVALLSNGRYHVVVTSAGGGYSRWNDLALTRFREDRTQDCWGLFCYLRDTRSGVVWSAAHQPTGAAAQSYEALFSQGKAEFRRLDEQVETHTQISVSPEDDVEVRSVTLRNRSKSPRQIELTTYGEVVLAAAGSDQSHPAFSNLFMQTELLRDAGAILCTRRPRKAGETPPWLFHLVTVGGGAVGEASYETDRGAFIGRARTPRRPAALAPGAALTNSQGAVLDPIVAIRRVVELPPGEEATLHVILGAAATRAAAGALIDKYRDHRLAERVGEAAWTQGQVFLQQLGASAVDAVVFGKLASPLIFADASLRASASLIARNRKGQPSLWGYSISGDLPVVVFNLGEPDGLRMVRRLVQAHAWWRTKGLRCDLLILVDEGTGYRQNLVERVQGLLGATAESAYVEKPGGFFVRNVETIPPDDRQLLQSVARMVLSDRGGPLEDQAERFAHAELSVPSLKPRVAPAAEPPPPAPAAPPRRDLVSFNGLGGFTRDGKEYVIHLDPGKPTPAPWANVIASALMGTVISESGSSYSWAENAHEFRLTTWHNDPVCDTTGEAFYLRDDDTGRFWSPSPLPAHGRGPYTCRHGQGYTIFEHEEEEIFSETTVYVAIDAPVKFVSIKLRNTGGRTRRLSASSYAELVLGELRDKAAMHTVTRVDPRTGGLLASNAFNPDFASRVAFAQCYPGERTFTCDRTEFIGRNQTPARPAAMLRQRLSNRSGAALDPCFALQAMIEIPPGEEREVIFTLGAAGSDYEAQQLLQRFRGPQAARQALEAVWRQWQRLLGAIYVETPDPAFNALVNQWCIYQVIACRFWGRSGYYQSGGAFGFRDQLQDAMALLFNAPWLLREQIVRSAGRQFKEGDVQHWWHPPTGRGVRTHFSDDYLFLPFAVCRYVTGTGDVGVLDQPAPFLTGRAVRDDEESYYELPGQSDTPGTIYEHCVRAIRHALSRMGSHGLPLMGCGDWNDGMNRVGEHGKGESVWLAFFLFDVMKQFEAVAQRRGDTEFLATLKKEGEALRAHVEEHAWDGQWYRRAYFDDGRPLGSAQNSECQIDSIAQSWAVLSGAAPPQRARQAMGAVAQRLVHDDLRLIQLFDPPFDKGDQDPGYIKGYVPGVRENGGQYTHAAIWTAMAFAALRDVGMAWKCYRYLNPVFHADTPERTAIYKVEPYAVVADVYTNPQHPGRGGWTWYTGSAGWFFRFMLETLLGLRLEVDKLSFTPLLPPERNDCKVHYRYRETLYHVTLRKAAQGEAPRVVADGAEQADGRVTLVDDRHDHQVEVVV
jgi:cellobiose phosphorylase